MAEPFIGEIRMFGGNFAPRSWALCNGQLLPISQYTTLFSILGTTYGGDGRSTFALPNLQARAPMHWGHGPGLSARTLGEAGGADSVTLTDPQDPAHRHSLAGDTGLASSASPSGGVYMTGRHAGVPPGPLWAYGTQAPDTALNANTVEPAGGGEPHNNMMPYLTVNFIIALAGIFPPRS